MECSARLTFVGLGDGSAVPVQDPVELAVWSGTWGIPSIVK